MIRIFKNVFLKGVKYIESFLQKDYSQYLGRTNKPDITELNEELWRQLKG